MAKSHFITAAAILACTLNVPALGERFVPTDEQKSQALELGRKFALCAGRHEALADRAERRGQPVTAEGLRNNSGGWETVAYLQFMAAYGIDGSDKSKRETADYLREGRIELGSIIEYMEGLPIPDDAEEYLKKMTDKLGDCDQYEETKDALLKYIKEDVMPMLEGE